MKYVHLSCILIVSVSFSFVVEADAAGAKKLKLFNIEHLKLTGNNDGLAHKNWELGYKLAPASLASSSTQEFFALNYAILKHDEGYDGKPPPLKYITRLSSSGKILSIDQLPTVFQTLSSDCNNEGCTSKTIDAYPVTSNPGRLVVTVYMFNFTKKIDTVYTYVFDPSTSNKIDRWTLISNGIEYGNGSLSVLTKGTTNFYVFDQSAIKSTSVYQVLNK